MVHGLIFIETVRGPLMPISSFSSTICFRMSETVGDFEVAHKTFSLRCSSPSSSGQIAEH